MSAPTNMEQLEEFADSLGMDHTEMKEFCRTELESLGCVVIDPHENLTDFEIFERNMAIREMEVTQIYHGRNSWEGPAVISNECDSTRRRSVILKFAGVECQWDNMGRDFIVYPKAIKGERL